MDKITQQQLRNSKPWPYIQAKLPLRSNKYHAMIRMVTWRIYVLISALDTEQWTESSSSRFIPG